MIIRLAYLLCFILILTKSFSQKNNVSLEVRRNANEAIPFATLTFLNEKKQFVCNSNGKFAGVADVQDSFLVSSVGFEDAVFQVRNLQNDPIVVLHPKITLMNEVVIKNGKKQALGNSGVKMYRSIIGADSSAPSVDIAKLIKAKDIYNEFRILKVSFRQKHFSNEMIMMLHIYSVDDDGLPGKDLLTDSLFMVRAEMFNNGVITFDIRSANLILKNEDFFVGLQFLHPFDNKLIKRDVGIAETIKEPEVLTYNRSNHFKRRWHTEYTDGLILPKQGQFKEQTYLNLPDRSKLIPINLIAGVEIEVFNP